jgi:hypothetical protein
MDHQSKPMGITRFPALRPDLTVRPQRRTRSGNQPIRADAANTGNLLQIKSSGPVICTAKGAIAAPVMPKSSSGQFIPLRIAAKAEVRIGASITM